METETLEREPRSACLLCGKDVSKTVGPRKDWVEYCCGDRECGAVLKISPTLIRKAGKDSSLSGQIRRRLKEATRQGKGCLVWQGDPDEEWPLRYAFFELGE